MVRSKLILPVLLIVAGLVECNRSKVDEKYPKFNYTVRPAKLIEDVKALYTKLRPGTRIENVKTYPLNNGLVNSLIHLVDETTGDQVVFRTFGVKLSRFADPTNRTRFVDPHNRELELATLRRASELNITSKLIATYNNGLVMQYIDGDIVRSSTYDIEIGKELARRLAKFHRIKLGNLVRNEPLLDSYADGKRDRPIRGNATLMALLEEEIREKFDEFRSKLPSYSELRKQFAELYQLLLKRDVLGEIVFGHNDLNGANIMIESGTRTPYMIDFETANSNYRYYDIGYFFVSLGSPSMHVWRAEDVPDDRLKESFLISYHTEWDRLTNRFPMTNDQFARFIDGELNKVRANMLLAMLYYIERSIFKDFMLSGAPERESIRNFLIPMYEHYVANKDKQLRFLDDESVRSNEATNLLNSIYLIASLGCLLLSRSTY